MAATADVPTSAVQPVNVVIERTIVAGAVRRFDEGAQRFVKAAEAFHGHEGASILAVANSGQRIVLLRFADAASLQRWERSADYAVLLREARRFSASRETRQTKSGLETWFVLPHRSAPDQPPPKWKMAIVTWAALLPLALAVGSAVAPLQLPFVPSVAINTAIPVAILTWFAMPAMTRLLYPWLYLNPTKETL